MSEEQASQPVTDENTSTELPDDMQDIAESMMESFASIWNSFIDHTPYIFASMLVLLITWIISKIVTSVVSRTIGKANMRESLKDLLLRFVSMAIWSLGILFAAMILFPGLTPSKALGALGLVSIAVGLAFKDIFENFFAGILLLWRFPFEKGDFIECEGLEGRIEEILIRMTMIRKTSGELVVVPNSFLFKNPVDIMTNKPHRRMTVQVGIAYDEEIEPALKVITDAVNSCETVLKEMPVQIWPVAFGSSSIDIDMTWWTKPEPVDQRRSRGEVITAVKAALDKAGIEIPFPYRTLTMKDPFEFRNVGESAPSGG